MPAAATTAAPVSTTPTAKPGTSSAPYEDGAAKMAGGLDNRIFPKPEGAPFKLSLSGGFSAGARTVALRNIPARSRVRAVHSDSISTVPISPVA